jgi:lipopolysaccharide/colanic/teichoic acid biosynthesis glycosyltransferase
MTPEQLAPAKPARHEFLSRPEKPPGIDVPPILQSLSLVPPPVRREPDWQRLSPTGPYARWGKAVLRVSLTVLVLPVALALSLPIVLINLVLFRDLRLVLYKQPRIGRRGRVFEIFKFRTMREANKGDFESWSEGHDDQRVTGFGRLLRNTHLDELPQLLNILRGEMGFVGPRPEMIEIHEWVLERIPDFEERNTLLPGITGYAQITQGYTGMDEREYTVKLAADQHYRRNFSLLLDLEILLRTPLWMLRGRGWNSRPRQEPSQEDGTPREEGTRAYARVQ